MTSIKITGRNMGRYITGRNKNIFLIPAIALAFLLMFTAVQKTAAQTNTGINNNPGSHRGAVTAMLTDDMGRIISAGEDGFFQIWDRQKNAAAERFQIGLFPITAMSMRPGKYEIAFVLKNDSGLYGVTVWNYETKSNIFTLPFDEAFGGAYYSASGSFLLVTGKYGVRRFNSDTGAEMTAPAALTGEVNFAATGRSERSMVAYSRSGYLSYWDLETGSATQVVSAPAGMDSPLLLGNNRFLAGVDSGGLVIADAVTGKVLVRDQLYRNGILFTGNPEGLEFICLVPGTPGSFSRYPSTLYHLAYRTPNNRIDTVNRKTVPSVMPLVNSGVVISSDTAALGTADGRVIVFSQNGSAKLMDTHNQTLIQETAISSTALAFITADTRLGFVPADFNDLNPGSLMQMEDCSPYTSITGGDTDFILWQQQNTRSFPMIKQVSVIPERGTVSETYINRLTLRFPLRSVSAFGNLYLFMDTVGNITIINQDTSEVVFTYLSTGAQDAVFIDKNNILIGRNTGQGSGAFMMINIVTGETVSLPMQIALGTKVYRGSSGALYGAAISSSYKTSLVSINTANPARSYSLAEIDAEEPNPAMAEEAGVLAVCLDPVKAKLFNQTEGPTADALQRSPGFPVRLQAGGGYIISADTDGNICWHDPVTGRILAVFRLFSDSWVLDKYDNGENDPGAHEVISGKVTGNK
ncbi:MAG: hypothetical protein FWD78_11895 [Treponema sp.]|nr:hypothetical protein [Treponema sp.]